MIVVEVHRIKAIKKAILFLRFIETASMQIAESKGDFDLLPPAAQTSILNVAFAAQFLRIQELSDFGGLIFSFFQNNLTFNKMFECWEGLDEELKDHCEKVKLQRVPDKEVADFYVQYMARHVLQADPTVINKIANNEYSNQIPKSYGSNTKVNEFVCPAEITRRKLAEEQLRQEQESKANGTYAGFGGNNNMPQGNNSWGQVPQQNQGWGQMPPPNYQQNQGQQAFAKQQGFVGQTQPYTPEPKQFQGHNPNAYISESQLPINQRNEQNSSLQFANPFAIQPQGIKPNTNNHNDIFDVPNNYQGNKQAQPPAFGGPATGKGNTGDQQFDQFLKDLDDLKKI